MKRSLFVLLAAISIGLVSCSKDEGIADNPTTVTLNKEWYVRVQGPVTTSNYSIFSTRTLIIVETVDTLGTQQSRTLKDTMILDDHNQLNPSFRSNVRIDAPSRTFGAGQYKNWNTTTDSLIVKEGKMIKDGGRSRSGRVVDSIYIKYAFRSAPAVEYQLKGHARSGYVEDEY